MSRYQVSPNVVEEACFTVDGVQDSDNPFGLQDDGTHSLPVSPCKLTNKASSSRINSGFRVGPSRRPRDSVFPDKPNILVGRTKLGTSLKTKGFEPPMSKISRQSKTIGKVWYSLISPVMGTVF